jgi:predicted amidohydrolase
MRVSALQFSPIFHDTEGNLKKVEKMLSTHQTDLIIIPELFNTGYMFKDRSQLREFAEDFSHSKTIDKLINIAGEKDCAIVAGIAEKEGDKLYNSSVIVDGKGIITTYRKLHLFWNEKDLFDIAENPLPVVDYKGAKLGLMVCFDWAFPEVVRTLAMKGAEIICHPADLVLTYCQKVMVARSIENKVFTITANRLGKERIGEKESEFTGHSQITGIKGEILDKAELEETIISADIDPKDAHDKTLTPKNHVFDDRREDYYYK